VALLACTNDDLTNIQACLHARRLNPAIRTVARIFDDQLAEHLTPSFQIDAAVSSGKVAAGAFVGTATEERALRPFQIGDLAYVAFRFDVTAPVSLSQIQAWRAEGVRILGFRRQSGSVQPPSQLDAPFAPGDAAIVAGPEAAIRSLLLTPLSSGNGRPLARSAVQKGPDSENVKGTAKAVNKEARNQGSQESDLLVSWLPYRLSEPRPFASTWPSPSPHWRCR
jgi:hypothetical protein